MRAKLRTLMDQRAAAWSKVQDIQDRREKVGYESTEEDGETYTRALDDVQRLSDEIEVEERADRLEAIANKPVGDLRSYAPQVTDQPGDEEAEKRYAAAFSSYLRRGAVDMDGEQRKALAAGFVAPESRAAGSDTGGAGGYTVPTGFLDRMVETLKAFGGTVSAAETITTTTGQPLPWPKNDDTNNAGDILTQNTQVTEQDFTFGQGQLDAYMFTSKLVRVAFQLLQDSAFNLDTWLPVRLGTRLGRGIAKYAATGTGVSQPNGIVTGLTLGITSAVAAKVGYDDLIDLEHSVDAAYRQGGNCRYLLNDSAVREIRKIKDSQNRPLWVPQMAGGIPSTINGQPYTVDNSLPAFAAAAKPIIFGDIKAAFITRIVSGAQVLRLSERYADFLQVGFLGFERFDSDVQDTAAAAVMTIHV